MDINEHLKQRRLDKNLYISIGIDEEDCVVTFPLWNLMGQMVGFQRYRPDRPKFNNNPYEARYFTKINKSSSTALGLDLLNPENRVLFITEGIFDASPLHIHKANALSVLCNNPLRLKNLISSLGYYTIALCEGDEAGEELKDVTNDFVKLPDGKDPGDMENDWFVDLIKFYK